MLHETFDGSALAGGVSTLEEHNDTLAGVFDPCLKFQQFDLEMIFLRLVRFAGHQISVRVHTGPPRFDELVVGTDGNRPENRFVLFEHDTVEQPEVVR